MPTAVPLTSDTTEFWYQLARRPVATNDAALHALLLYLDGADPATDYESRLQTLRARGLLPADFAANADAPLHRGNLAYALARALGIRGGLTMQLLGPSPRYATRAMEARGLFPPGTPNQPLSGAQFVGVMGRTEDFQRGDASNKPAFLLPGEEVMPPVDVLAPPDDVKTPPPSPPQTVDAAGTENGTRAVMLNVANTAAWQNTRPADDAATRPQSADDATTRPQSADDATPEQPLKLAVTVTGVEGSDVEVRTSDNDPWVLARVGMHVGETAEFRTGPRSAVRFFVCPNHVFTLDRQGSLKVLKAYYDGRKVATDVGIEQGRVRAAVERLPQSTPPAPAEPNANATPPAVRHYQVEDAGIEHECTIRSPNTALAVRGTMVSLFDQPPFAPEAVSLTGRAVFQNVRRELVAFGRAKGGKARVSGAQSSAAEHAEDNAILPADSAAARNDFETQEAVRVASRGGFSVGNVLVGNSSGLPARFPGDLNFVLNWNVPGELHDLNLVVISPKNFPDFDPATGKGSFDYVANPPFGLSAGLVDSPQRRVVDNSQLVPVQDTSDTSNLVAYYPKASRTGGQIGPNHVGPQGREIAYWPKGYPTGTYKIEVYNTVDALDGSAAIPAGKSVDFTVQAFQRVGKKVQPVGPAVSGSLQEFQTSEDIPIVVNPPAAAASGVRAQVKRGR